MTHPSPPEQAVVGGGTFTASPTPSSRRAQAVAACASVLAVCSLAVAGFRWYTSGPSGNPFRDASVQARTSWKLDDLGQGRREEFTGLLQGRGVVTRLHVVQARDGSGNATTGGDDEVGLRGGGRGNFSFPIMPSTEEEWQRWEAMQGDPRECVPVIQEDFDPEGIAVQTFAPDCSDAAIKAYHEEIARQQATLLKPRPQSLASTAAKASRTAATVDSRSISDLMKAVASSKQALASERARLESLQKEQARARLQRKDEEHRLREARDRREQKLADMSPGMRVLYLMKEHGRPLPDE